MSLKDKIREWLEIEDWRFDVMQRELDKLRAEVEQLKKERELDAADMFLKISKAYYESEENKE